MIFVVYEDVGDLVFVLVQMVVVEMQWDVDCGVVKEFVVVVVEEGIGVFVIGVRYCFVDVVGVLVQL